MIRPKDNKKIHRCRKEDKADNKKERGFTLTELLVAMGIVMLISSISLTNYNKFGRTVDLENTAYAVALAVREAQVFGINRLSDSLSGTDEIDLDTDTNFGEPIPYGVYFDLSSTPVPGAGTESFINFVDVVESNQTTEARLFNDNSDTGNCVENSSSECLSVAAFTGNTYIKELCAGPSGANCSSVDYLHISFKRPDPDAVINVAPNDTRAYARITLGSNSDPTIEKSVSIGVAGQITIN